MGLLESDTIEFKESWSDRALKDPGRRAHYVLARPSNPSKPA
jgi:hypothetical protein